MDLYYRLDFLMALLACSYILGIAVDQSSIDDGTEPEAAQKGRTSKEECLL